jgi:hypothetical protein
MSTLRIGLIGFVSLLGLSCSDDDDGPRPFSSGLGANAGDAGANGGASGNASAGAPVSSLDADDKAQLCRSYGAHLSTSVGFDLVAQAVCLPQAILLGGSPQGCRQRLDACVDDVPPPLQINASVGNVNVCTQTLAECNLSVAQLEACINLRLDWVYELVDTLSCAGAGSADSRSRADAMRGAAVCVGAAAGCDRFIDVNPEPVLL